ncbi:EAL domain-containing protein [Azonexus sp.]|uniref:EAL domain-containing protein n=1 Tax=Azonexus sp. TaxID=1872668 RepID=UPI0039E5462E
MNAPQKTPSLGAQQFRDFNRRLAFAFGALILLLMAVVLLAGNVLLQRLVNQEEERLSTLLTGVLAESINHIGFSSKYQARLLLEEIQKQHPEIRYLLIADADGKILAHSDPTQNDAHLPAEIQANNQRVIDTLTPFTRSISYRGEPLHEVTLPYRTGFERTVQGSIQIGLSEASRAAAVRQGAILITALVLVLMVIGILVVRILSRRFGRPLRLLTNDLQATLQAIPDILFEFDRSGRYLNITTENESLLARDKNTLLGRQVHDVLSRTAADTVLAAIDEADRTGSSHGRQVMLDLPGGKRWFELSVARKRPLSGQEGSFVILSRDISERHAAYLQGLLANNVFESSREGILVTDPQQRIVRVNSALCRLSGYSKDELRGQTPALLRSITRQPEAHALIQETLLHHDYWQGEIWNRHKDGSEYPLLLSVNVIRDGAGNLLHYVSFHADISGLKASEAKLEHMAHHDALTGLGNRLLLHIRLEHALSRAQREGKGLALLMLDLDHFKDINDSFGHAMGDALLQQIAARLSQRVRGTDTVCRLGGDEFTVLVENLEHPDDAAKLAEDIAQLIEQNVTLPNGSEVAVGCSIGIALYPEHGDNMEELLQQADAALYRAKAEGRGHYQFYTERLTQEARQRIALETRLRRAISNQELLLHFQPQIDTHSGKIFGAEALVRWLDPEHGLMPPGDFIPLAEQSNLIVPLGDWVLQETCRQGRAWIDAGLAPLTLAVNVSSRQFHYGNLVDKISAALAASGFPAEYLELELTEGVLMQHRQEVSATLNKIRALGVRIAIDDFGTGYSSLSYLKAFPLDVLKIDRSFVRDIPNNADDMEIAATIIAMAHTLRLKVLAEGVETPEQLAFLRAHACDYYQGFLTSRPLSAQAFANFIHQHAADSSR